VGSGSVLATGLEHLCPALRLAGHSKATPQPKEQPQLQRDKNPMDQKTHQKREPITPDKEVSHLNNVLPVELCNEAFMDY